MDCTPPTGPILSSSSPKAAEMDWIKSEEETPLVIDGIYEVIKVACALKKSSGVAVLQVKDLKSNVNFALKLFPLGALGELEVEAGINNALSPHPRIIRSVRAVVSHHGSPSINIDGENYDGWGYLLVPYCRHGTLIDLVLNASLR